MGGVSGKVQSWAVASSRCSGIWPRREEGSVPLVKCGGVCGGAGGGSLGWWGGAEPGPARSLCWPGRG